MSHIIARIDASSIAYYMNRAGARPASVSDVLCDGVRYSVIGATDAAAIADAIKRCSAVSDATLTREIAESTTYPEAWGFEQRREETARTVAATRAGMVADLDAMQSPVFVGHVDERRHARTLIRATA